MKKYASLLLFALMLNGCDDGDLTVDTIDFEQVTTSQACSTTNELIYKLKGQEALLVQVPLETFGTDPSLIDEPYIFDINNSTYRVVYRAYSGTIATANICNAIPPTTPNVTEEWVATSGKMEIITVPVYTTNETTGATRITAYNHNITFKNITFQKPSGPQTQETFIFGDFKSTIDTENTLDLAFDESASQCAESKQIYNFNASSAITIDNIAADLVKNEATPANTPRTGLIGETTNKLAYKVYTGNVLSDAAFCGTLPASIVLKETWTGVNGAESVSGIIEVTTTTFTETSFKHTIVLKNATLRKGNNTFNLGKTFLVGELVTQTN
ncbi:hypothetical protein [Flavobacterium hercynium]|uniref:Lipoprotein n=1 Tax=Flavobacterium hercynium TaxID=387094 RepID=A0A226HUH2_9FLAO|nr:hypothetical protein [Flavobacterium hercynium]OXA97296.1 hypothetical protein B0A66_00195 [Flavobacterium hercynium]SMP18292.1 hypothetical protein SAMN06265346_105229 [Flavobacterium hercynium]